MMRLVAVVAIALVALASGEKVKFDNYKVYRIIPSSDEHLEVLKQLENFPGDAYQYWQSPSRVFEPVDLMVAPENSDEFSELMDLADMRYETYVEDVQKLINEENPLRTRATGKFDWTSYHTIEEIYAYLESLAEKYPNNVRVVDAGKTYEGRVIKGVKLSFGKEKPGVFIEGGIHAREWISPATVTYILNEFLTSNQPEIRKLAESYDWYVFPSFNPDGYVYTHTTNRLWRKTVSKTSGSYCNGVDANRNWDYKWMVAGSSNNPCAETYAGKSAFSEIETKSMSEYIKSIGHKLFAYVSFHSYSQLLMFPYGHTEEHLDNYDESLTIGKKSIEALAKRYGTQYRTGNIAETIYPATGSTTDWAKGTLKLPVSFVYELRDTGRYGFVLPANQIIPNGQEVMDSLIVMFQESAKFGYPKPQH